MANPQHTLVAEALPGLAPRTVRALAVLVDFLVPLPLLFVAWTATFGSIVGILGSFSMHPHGFGGWSKLWAARAVGLGSTVMAFLAWGAFIALSLYQMYLLASRGQTIGKRLFAIRIVDMNGRPAGFMRALVLRTCVFPSAMALLAGLLSAVVPAASLLLALLDLSFGLAADRRCLHDHFAGTQVRWVRNWSVHTGRIAVAFGLVAGTAAGVYGYLYRATLLGMLHVAAARPSAPPRTSSRAVVAQPATASRRPVAAPAPSVPPAPPTPATPSAPVVPREPAQVETRAHPPAVFYRYEDAQGVIHIVKSLDEVPEARRASARPIE